MNMTKGSGDSTGPHDLEDVLPPMASPKRHHNSMDSLPTANYNALSERFRKSTPSDIQCAVLCGGRKCRFESSANWTRADMALPGFYSHWVTEDIVAMARPNMETIKQYDLVKTFNECGIKSIINLQEPGEHASCGNALTSSGFSYEPSTFMDNDVFFYNFHWKDYSTVGESQLLDMVKVMTFALTEGKCAVHCHAGLGRTGVFIASYLVFTWRCRPQDAIRFVRSKRVPKHYGLNLVQHLKRQQHLLHGFEARHLRFIPKILYIICERLLHLCNRSKTRSPGLLRSTSIDSATADESAIDFQLTNSENFTKYFFASAKSSAETPAASRPQSNMTIQLSSGFASPDTTLTAMTDLSCGSGSSSRRGGTADSRKSNTIAVVDVPNRDQNNSHAAKSTTSLPALVGISAKAPLAPPPTLVSSLGASTGNNSAPSSSLYHHYHLPVGQFINSLPPVEELSDSNSISAALFPDINADLNGPLRQIGLVGLDTPKRTPNSSSGSSGRRVTIGNNLVLEDSLSDGNRRESGPNSPCDSLTSLIEKTLGYRLMSVDVDMSNSSNDVVQFDQQHNSGDFSDSSESYTHFEEVLARTGLVSHEMYQDYDERSLEGHPPNVQCNHYHDVCGPDETSLLDPFLVASALLTDYRTMQSTEFEAALTKYQRDLNNRASAWERISRENNVELLSALLWSWLENLKEPIFNRQALTYIVLKAEKPIDALIKLETGARYTCEYLLRFIARLQPQSEEILDYLIRRLVAGLAHQCVKVNGQLVPGNVTWSKMRKGTTGRVILFLNGLYHLLADRP